MVGDEVREAAGRPLVSSADYGQDFDKMMKLKTQREEDHAHFFLDIKKPRPGRRKTDTFIVLINSKNKQLHYP